MSKNITKNDLRKFNVLKVFSFTSLSTLVKMVAGIVSVKVIAVILGPSGVALIGQLNNFTAIVLAIATLGIQTGITKIVAQYKEDKEKLTEYLVFATFCIIVTALVCGLVLILFSSFFSNRILHNSEYNYIFIIFGVTLLFYALNTLLLAIINGFKDFKLYVALSMISSIVGLLLSLCLVFLYKIPGAFINAVTSQSLVFFINIVLLKSLKKFDFSLIKPKKNILDYLKVDIIKFYGKYALMTIFPSIMLPLMQLLIRTFIITKMSVDEAGWWEGINKISNMYLSVVTTALSVYYVPRYSELQSEKELKQEIKDAYKIICPFLFVGLLAVYFLRNIVISILFSSKFSGMEQLFMFQLVGDFFKMSSWILSFMMGAKIMLKESIFSEIIFDITYVFFTFLGLKIWGIQGAVIGYMVNYIIYLIAMYFIVYKRISIIASR